MSSQTVCILGRLPALGLAELESLYGADRLKPLDGQTALLDLPPDQIDHQRLGGTVKKCKLLTRLDFTDWHKITEYLVENVPKHAEYLEPGKLTFGISAYGFKASPKAVNAAALSVKKAVRTKSDRPVRIVPNKEAFLSSAQVLHNGLTKPNSMELVLIKAGHVTWLAQNLSEQDIEAYAARDQARPARDARVGMLPPKLAQTIINLANPAENSTVLDPFCGTGVVLQEALLMGYRACGTDLNPRMVEYSSKNLTWLKIAEEQWQTEAADATNHTWQLFDTIAAETYLGRPFSAPPKPEVLAEVMRDVDTIHRKFLQNVARQTRPGFRMCIAVPAWRTKNGFLHLKTLDHLGELGYTRMSFKHADNQDLIYHRENQIVGRELATLIRK